MWLEHTGRRGWRGVAAIDSVDGVDGNRLLGVAYGYCGAPDQWWQQQVTRGLHRVGVPAAEAAALMSDYFELTELHIHPSAQGRGLGEALVHYDVALLGGDTVKGPRVLSLTAIGRTSVAPSRSGALAGDALWVTGVIGRGGLGLRADPDHLAAYRRPAPRLAEGKILGPIVHAMMDVSDGLLIDTRRMADASGLAVEIDLDAVPVVGERMAAVTAGDDYELLFALPAGIVPSVAAKRIGAFRQGRGLTLYDGAGPVPMPDRLGWQHGV
jgi:thiamin-phosphate kinase